ncbi:MAG: nucleotidyltransferase family protein [Alphaproteobacteria bacterium]|nr:MAG: nucleotidyltransferase family protein [Alphaproteobacteria bacterium]
MVFAAGFGTRMGALTAERPKPLIELSGRSLIDRTLDLVEAAGIPRAVINLHYRAGMIRRHLAGRDRPEIAFSEERPAILDTGGGMRKALPLLHGDPVLGLNSDAVWQGNPLPALLAAWQDRMEALLLVVRRENALCHAGTGDFFLDASGRLARRGGRASAPYVYTGAQILRTGRLAAAPSGAFSLNRIWDAMGADGGLFGLVWPRRWVDVGTPAGIEAAEALLAEGTR